MFTLVLGGSGINASFFVSLFTHTNNYSSPHTLSQTKHLLHDLSIESSRLEIRRRGNLPLLLGCVYRPASASDFLDPLRPPLLLLNLNQPLAAFNLSKPCFHTNSHFTTTEQLLGPVYHDQRPENYLLSSRPRRNSQH